MVLAAGRGTRLRPLTERIPKPLIFVGGRPLIAYSLLQLRAAGVREVAVNLHHRAEQIRAALGDGSRFGLHLRFSEEPRLLDTGGALARLRDFFCDGPFFVLNADSIHDVPLRELSEFHGQRGAIATLVLRPDPGAARFGLVEVDRESRVRRFLGAPPDAGEDLVPLMYAGVSIFSPEVFGAMPRREVFSLTRDLVPRLLARGAPVFGFRYGGYWCTVDTPSDLAAARRDLASAPPFSYLVSLWGT